MSEQRGSVEHRSLEVHISYFQCYYDRQNFADIMGNATTTAASDAEDSSNPVAVSCEINNCEEIRTEVETDEKLNQMPEKLKSLSHLPTASKLAQRRHAWNPWDSSLNIYVKVDDPLTCHRLNSRKTTDCIRGKVGFAKGLHTWSISWKKEHRGSNAVVGVATLEAPLEADGYVSLVGQNEHSWGWDLGRNKALHNCRDASAGLRYPAFSKPGELYDVPETLTVVLDMDEGTLAFVAEGRYLGVAFDGLKGKRLYPIVSTVFCHCDVRLEYVRGVQDTLFLEWTVLELEEEESDSELRCDVDEWSAKSVERMSHKLKIVSTWPTPRFLMTR